MRNIKLSWHVGFAKTATTFIQKTAESLPGIFHIGKYPSKERALRFLNNLSAVHNKLFVPHYADLVFANTYPGAQSVDLLDAYADIVVELIVENPDYQTFFISDEIICDYRNRIGERNLAYVVYIINKIIERFHETASFQAEVVFTIRNQVDLLGSHFAYDPTIRSPFRVWLKKELGCRTPFAESLKFNQIADFFGTLSGFRIAFKVVPYEILSIDKDSKGFLELFFGRQNIISPPSLAVNANSVYRDDIRVYNKRLHTYGYHCPTMMLRMIDQVSRSRIKDRRFLIVILRILKFITSNIQSLTNAGERTGLIKVERAYGFKISESESRTIKDYYKSANASLASHVNVDLLKKFGYLDE